MPRDTAGSRCPQTPSESTPISARFSSVPPEPAKRPINHVVSEGGFENALGLKQSHQSCKVLRPLTSNRQTAKPLEVRKAASEMSAHVSLEPRST